MLHNITGLIPNRTDEDGSPENAPILAPEADFATGRSTIRGSTSPVMPISASACPRRAATSSTGCASRWITSQTRAQQQRALEILQFKLDILWSMLDAMQIAYGIGPERAGAGTPMPDE